MRLLDKKEKHICMCFFLTKTYICVNISNPKEGTIMNIDYQRIYIENLNNLINKKRYDEIVLLAKCEHERLMQYGLTTSITQLLSARARLIANSEKYSNLNTIEKTLLETNIVYSDKKIADILKAGNFNFDSIISFMQILAYLKYKTNKNTLTEKDSRYQAYVNKYAENLTKYFTLYSGNADINIIINKISEVLSFNRSLLSGKVKKNKANGK